MFILPFLPVGMAANPAQTLVGLPAARAAHWAPAARLAPPTAPRARLFLVVAAAAGAEECPSK